MSLNASNTVKAAALLMAMPALLLPIKAAGQQMAAAGSSANAWPATVAECQAIKDIAKRGQCTVEVGTAVNLRATQLANDEGACADQLKELRTRDPSVVERGKTILAGQKLQSFGVCKLLGQLTKS